MHHHRGRPVYGERFRGVKGQRARGGLVDLGGLPSERVGRPLGVRQPVLPASPVPARVAGPKRPPFAGVEERRGACLASSSALSRGPS
eukprot:7791659-Lingulodinium_polyedra.AAC.1